MQPLERIIIPKDSLDETGRVAELYFETGQAVRAGDVILDFETAKAVVAMEAGVDGVVRYLCRVGDELNVGDVVAEIWERLPEESAADREAGIEAKPEAGAEAGSLPESTSESTVFSRAALQALRDKGLGPEAFLGKDFVSARDVVGDKPAQGTSEAGALPVRKRAEVENLSVNRETLNSTLILPVDLRGFFQALAPAQPRMGDSALPVVLHEASRLLADHPDLNACFQAGQGVARHDRVVMGFAVDAGQGLLVAAVPGADGLSLAEVDERVFDGVRKAALDELSREDMAGVTFTVTDLSPQGAAFFVPLISRGQSAVLGLGGFRPESRTGFLCLAFDHRASSGREGSAFLAALRDRLETYGSKEPVCARCGLDLPGDAAQGGPGLIVVRTDQGEEWVCANCLLGF